MISNVEIQGFKSIDSESLKLVPLTILTGVNSSGKSTVIQALLLFIKYNLEINRYSMEELTHYLSDFSSIRNKSKNAKVIKITVSSLNNEFFKLIIDNNGESAFCDFKNNYIYDSRIDDIRPEIFYLSANRIGPQLQAIVSERKVGYNAEFIFSHFEKIKRNPLPIELVHFNGSNTIDFQVSKWLSYVTETESKLVTELVTTNNVNISFDTTGIKGISPLNLGAGISYVAKVIILCLMAKKGDLVIIENPEIHLHPKAQAQLGVFFTFIAKNGIQLIIETHCEHLINKISYQVYREEISSNDVAIYYKSNVSTPFQILNIDENGDFTNSENKIISFPKGFFDASLADLMDMR